MESIDQQLTISIATKDRPEVVEATLRKIHAFGLGDCPLILCDDGSSPALQVPALALFPRGRLIRNEVAQGQALARNQIAQECRTPYLLQLDDDSYPVEGDLGELCAYAAREKGWLAIALPFKEPARGRDFPTGLPKEDALQVRSFVGCSVLMDVERFRALGGYASWIGGMAEEDELCYRSLAAGQSIRSIDVVRIQHEVTATSRNSDRITRQSTRNCLLLWILHAPLIVLPWRMLRLLGGTGIVAVKQRNLVAFQGFAEGLRRIPALWQLRRSSSMKVYREFRRLPHALDFFKNQQCPGSGKRKHAKNI